MNPCRFCGQKTAWKRHIGTHGTLSPVCFNCIPRSNALEALKITEEDHDAHS